MAMPNKYLSTENFHALARHNAAAGAALERLGSVARAVDDRTYRFTLSDGLPDRMNDTIDPHGWETTGFRANPTVLWAHLSNEPPVGRVSRIFVANEKLMGDVQFPPEGIYEFADTIHRLVEQGFIRSCSVGFLPLEWEFSEDRRGGIDFHRQELLELSLVPVPANAHALIEAQAKSWGRGAALAERTEPLPSVMQYSGTSRDRRWFLANYLKQALKRG
jgi:HK97 family phage prohead protease